MFRKSALAIAMLGTLTTGNVVALGLGDIELKSALNQPLKAEVELLSATDSELQELKVEIGSSQAFANAGIDRPLFLTKLRFDVTTNAEGRPVVQITSRDVVREPFMDFLLEISWSKGRLLREYTVLIDPPVTMPATAPVPQTPSVDSVAPRSQVAPVDTARRVTHTAQMPPSVAPDEYLTQRHDTLWNVAKQLRPDTDVSVEQAMLGLQRSNPDAFYDNNINNLKAGYILRVPSREEMTSISRSDAAYESRAQYAAWREQRGLSEVAGTESVTQLAGADTGVDADPHLQLVAPDTAEGGAATASGEAAAELEAMQRELLMANEALEEERRQGEEMTSRLTALEDQVVNMQRLIQLKDEELARLQAQVGGEEGAELLAGVTGELETGMAEGEVPFDETAVTDDAGISPDTGLSAEGEVVVPDLMGADQAAVDETAVDEAPLTGEIEATEAPAETVVEDMALSAEAEPAVAEPVVAETMTPPGFVDRLLANPLWLGAGATVLALLGFFGLRRKRGVETEFQESILQAAQGVAAAEPATDSEIVASEPESKDSTTTESSLLSEFAVSDMGAIKNDGEADPLAEADVYLAYGRYQQAEDLIKDALESDTEREDLNLKLLEVFMAGKNQSAFDAHAQVILARVENSDDPTWVKVAEMGREMSPDNPMYQAGGALPAAADETAAMDAPDLDFTMDEGEAAPAEEQSAGEEQGLDFDIDLSSFEPDESLGEDTPDSVEFTPPEDLGEPATASEPDLGVDMDSVEPDAVAQDNTMDFDLEGFEMDSEGEAEGEGALADLDEVSTKLDLARAYIDMGDPDGAKSILDEVIEEGSDDQKDEARGIMEQMS